MQVKGLIGRAPFHSEGLLVAKADSGSQRLPRLAEFPLQGPQ